GKDNDDASKTAANGQNKGYLDLKNSFDTLMEKDNNLEEGDVGSSHNVDVVDKNENSKGGNEEEKSKDQGNFWERFKASKKASSSKPKSDYDDDSDEDEVYFPQEEYTSGMGGGFSLDEEDLDGFDGYEAHAYDLPKKIQTFCDDFDIRLNRYVLSSLHVYWASMFILPVFVCNSIDKMLKNFIWSKTDSSKGIASVVWKDVCRPKEQGGLGLKSLKVMNHSLMVKHLWNIASKKDSLWVKWLNAYRIKGNYVWNMKFKKNFSWNLKQILSLRDSIRRNVRYKIGNGKGCFIWYDRWHSNGPLSRLISDHVVKSNGFDLNAKVADFIGEAGWNWPSGWIVSFKDVVDVPVPVLDQNSVDKALCGFAQGLWNKLKLMCRLDDLLCIWAEVISGITLRNANNALWSIIQRLVFAAAVYFVWQECNFRLFRKIERTADRVFDIIVDTVRLRLMGLNIKRSYEVDKAAAIWNLTIKDVGVQGVSSVNIGGMGGIEEYSFGEVGWGGSGFQFWVGVIREYKVEKSNDPVLTHRVWGIRVFRMCSDKRRLSRISLVDSGFVRISPREGCKSGLDVTPRQGGNARRKQEWISSQHTVSI
ncbi:hypothetical protein Tco_1415470, partial [Tanacetum coccineum]